MACPSGRHEGPHAPQLTARSRAWGLYHGVEAARRLSCSGVLAPLVHTRAPDRLPSRVPRIPASLSEGGSCGHLLCRLSVWITLTEQSPTPPTASSEEDACTRQGTEEHATAQHTSSHGLRLPCLAAPPLFGEAACVWGGHDVQGGACHCPSTSHRQPIGPGGRAGGRALWGPSPRGSRGGVPNITYRRQRIAMFIHVDMWGRAPSCQMSFQTKLVSHMTWESATLTCRPICAPVLHKESFFSTP